ncbi:Protein borderless [Eumeta japonica]|uniref:Protein borderless n=1 Tax=Eumeta variegata TaxID=151549 RepID=A0A4C1VQM4_EUMVA|nr:Protein borderless [Eumeta japonica]
MQLFFWGETIFSWYSADSTPPKYAESFAGRVQQLRENRLGLGRGSINLTSVRETDNGLYRCRVLFPNRTPPTRNNGTYYFLEVEGGNLIATPPVNITCMEDERAEFECLPKSPESIVSWYKDGEAIADLMDLAHRTVLYDNGSLVIERTSMTDLGEYECHVRDPDGELQSASAFLDVQYKAKVTYSPKERFLPYGKPARLDCHFSANPPLTNLRWEKDGFLFDSYNVPGVYYSRNGSLLFNEGSEQRAKPELKPKARLGSKSGPESGTKLDQ